MNTLSSWARSKGISRSTAYRLYKAGVLPRDIKVTESVGPGGKTSYFVEETVSIVDQNTDRLVQIELRVEAISLRVEEMFSRLEPALRETESLLRDVHKALQKSEKILEKAARK